MLPLLLLVFFSPSSFQKTAIFRAQIALFTPGDPKREGTFLSLGLLLENVDRLIAQNLVVLFPLLDSVLSLKYLYARVLVSELAL